MPEKNPLTEIQFKVPFDKIRAEHVVPGIRELILEAKGLRDSLIANSEPRRFDNTMLAFENVSEKLGYAWSLVKHLEDTATYPELRDAMNTVQPEVTEFFSSLPLSAELWRVISEYEKSSDAKALKGEQARFLSETIKGFKHQGADLQGEVKERFNALNIELAKVTNQFGQNILDDTNAFELLIDDVKRLAGLPESAIAMARADAESKGKAGYRLTLKGPSYVATMTYLEDREIRETVYRAFSTVATKGQYDNRELLGRIIAIRDEKARILGFKNFADYVLSDRMAANGETASKFLDELQQKTKPYFDAENVSLREFHKAHCKDGSELAAWDVAYYSEKQRKALYDFDAESLRPYFPLPKVIEGMFAVLERIYGITVRETLDMPVWHESVKSYSVYDDAGTFLGSFYSDLFPRETKRGGAWMNGFITGKPVPGGFEPHLGLIAGNFSPPVDGKPALLTHSEVTTLFHEMGHLLHHVLSTVGIKSLGGTNVAWDFVELPSQIMENWCWEKEALDLFARHYVTNEPIPQVIYERMIRAKNYRSGNMMMRQLSFGCTDLTLHSTYDPKRDGDVVAYSRALMVPFMPVEPPADYSMITSFSHLFSRSVGYAAGYYSYKWAEVLESDVFMNLFQNNGIFDRKAGERFRREVLSRGNSDDAMTLFKNLMGRTPDSAALLIKSGLATH